LKSLPVVEDAVSVLRLAAVRVLELRREKVRREVHFQHGQSLEVVVAVEGKPAGVLLYYRHVTLAERFTVSR
jgi:hypothetical protein